MKKLEQQQKAACEMYELFASSEIKYITEEVAELFNVKVKIR